MRRATCYSFRHSASSRHFYPRSPCGERLQNQHRRKQKDYFYPRSPCGVRRQVKQTYRAKLVISIHALLAESDQLYINRPAKTIVFLSTLSLRRATAKSTPEEAKRRFLSTLSLRRATLDELCRMMGIKHFYPRSPCGERLILPGRLGFLSFHFYPRSPCGERPWLTSFPSSPTRISIHALLAESDVLQF